MDKLLYVDVVKKNLNNIVIEKKIINIKKTLPIRINQLLNKLLKNEYNKHLNKIKNLILSTDNNLAENNSLIQVILSIDKLIIENKTYTSNKNHYWISGQLIKVLQNFNYTSDIKIVDIGGGEGNILNYFNKLYDVPLGNLYIVEQVEDWSEKYVYQNNMNYIFWDNLYINIESDSIDIILIMVSLHHMNDTTIDNLMLNIQRILKKGGIIIIKEHNCKNTDDRIVINWEHHLYHLLMSKNINEENIKEYLDRSITNYKSMEEYTNIFRKYNFKHIISLNRSFNQYTNEEISNSTNLYWAIYKKIDSN